MTEPMVDALLLLQAFVLGMIVCACLVALIDARIATSRRRELMDRIDTDTAEFRVAWRQHLWRQETEVPEKEPMP